MATKTPSGQKPAHQVGPVTARDAIWIAIRELIIFTAGDIERHVWRQKNEARAKPDTIKTYLTGLENGGYIQRTKEVAAFTAVEYQLINNVGIEPPRVRKDGTKITQGEGRERMWRVIRMGGDFDYKDLAIDCSHSGVTVKPGEAKSYVAHLYKAGYLMIVKPASTHGGIATYCLLPSKNTGPKPPMVQRIKQVYDPNIGEVVWPKTGDDE